MCPARWRSQSLNLDEQWPRAFDAGKTATGLPRSRSDKNSSDGLAISHKRAGHLEHADFIGRTEAVLTARRTRNWCEPSPSNEHGIHHMFDERGPAIWPSLVTWPTRMIAALIFGKADQCRAARTWVTVPGADRPCRSHGWIRSITISRGVLPSDSVATMSSTEVSAASSTGCRANQPFGAQAPAPASSPEM